MTRTDAALTCYQCGRELPADAAEAARWKDADLVRSGELDEAMLVCPECRDEDREMTYDEGGAE
jgi:hypothetical protein